MSTPLPIPSPASMLAPGHKVNSFLDDVGNHVGTFLRSPHMAHVSSLHPQMLSVPGMVLPAAGVIVAAPVGVWAWKRRRHLRSSVRGLVSLKVWRERWRWHRRISKLEIGGHTAPKTMAAWPTRSGTTMVLKMADGMNMRLLQKEDFAHAITAHLACMDLAFEPIYSNKGQCLVHVGRKDSLAETFPWPWMRQETTDFFGRIPAGVDTKGKPVTMDLREHCVLVGGSTGAGKSWFLHSIVATAMLDKRVRVHILDGKWGVGFDVWEKAANSFATNDKDDLEHAYQIIKRLEERIDGIYESLRAQGKRTIDWATAKHIDLLILDEFTAFLGYKDIHKRLLNLIARGRAAGLILILATQRPSSKIMDTDFRALFHYRVAFWSDKEGSKMILGDGIKADSSEFSGMNPGEMWLLTEGRQPVRCRGYSLTDSQLAMLATRAQRLRAKSDAPNDSVPIVSADDAPQLAPDSPLKPRSPNSGPSLSLVPAVAVSGVAESPVAPPKALPKALRPTLVCIALHGPQVSSDVIRTELGVASSTQLARCHKLVDLGFVTGARKVSRPGRGSGGRDPMLWSITDLGTAALTRRPATKEGANA